MSKFLEIRWQGKIGQGVNTAASILAEMLIPEGKYIQTFPEYPPEERFADVIFFNRISESPIRLHSLVKNADANVILEPSSLNNSGINEDVKEDAIYVINTSYMPEFIKDKLSLNNNQLFTLDANTIALEEVGLPIPNIPIMTIVVKSLKLIPIETYKQRLEESLSKKLNSDLVLANIKTIDRTLKEVKEL